MDNQSENVKISVDVVKEMVSGKDMEILVLRTRVNELQKELLELIDAQRESAKEEQE